MKGTFRNTQSGHSAAASRSRRVWLSALSALAIASVAHAQTPRTWTAGTGVWSNPLNWSPNDVPNSPPETAIIAGAGGLTATLDIPALLVGASVTNPSAILSISPGLVLALGTAGLNTGLTNNGTIQVNSIGVASLTQLRFPAGIAISGTGRIQLNADASTLDSAFISSDTGFSWTNGSGHTVSGSGRLYGPIVNQGTIAADQAGKILQIAGDVQNTGGSIGASAGILELAQGARLGGGSLTSNVGALVRVVDQAGLASMTLNGLVNILSGARLEIGAGSLTGAFDLKVNDTGANAVTQAATTGLATLGGGGTSTTSLNANSADLDSAQLASEAGILAIGSGHTIRGTGRIYAALNGVPTINANVASRELEVLGDVDMSGGGGMKSTGAGSILSLGNGITVTGGTFAASAGSFGRIKNSASPLLRGTALSGNIEMRPGAVLRVDGLGLSNAGSLIVNSTGENVATSLMFTQNAAVTGVGNITLNANSLDLTTALIGGAPGVTLTNSAGHTIRGTGRVTLPITNQGALSANNPSGPLQFTANVTNSGAGAAAASNANLQLSNAMTMNAGSFSSFGTGRLAVPQGETATLNAFQINAGGVAHILGGATLLFTGGLINNGQIVVNPAGDLQLSRLRGGASTTLSGTGSVVLNANSNNLDSAMIDAPSFVITQNAGHTITGQGRIYAPLANSGVVSAGAVGQSLEIVSPITQSPGGRIRAAAGRLALRSGASVNGGQFDRTGSGRLTVDGAVSATSVRTTTPIDVAAGSNFGLSAFQNDNEIAVSPTVDSAITRISMAGTQTLLGTGSIVLNPLSNATVQARLDGPASPDLATLGQGQTLRGSGAIGGNVRIEGTIAPGTAPTGTGQIIFEEPLVVLPTTTLDFNLAGQAAYDSIAIQKPYTLGGKLLVALTGGYNPSSIHLFRIVDGAPGATRTGGFDTFTLPPPPATPLRRAWRLNYLPEDVTLRLTCAADFNGDGFVNDLDFQYFVFAYDELMCPTPDSPIYPLQPDPCPADLNLDGVVLDDDFVLFVQAYNLVICQ
ncbi:MAG: beta strand repeat-containing protein [Phycisphaerales bacterium]